MFLHEKKDFEERIAKLEQEVRDEKQYSDKLRNENVELKEQVSRLMKIVEGE